MFHQFYKKSVLERREILENDGFSHLELLAGTISDETELLDRMSENVIGAMRLPMGVLTGICVNGREHRCVMATEEPSVVAAVNKTAGLLNAAGGVCVEVDRPVTTAQIMVVCNIDKAEVVKESILANQKKYLDIANACDEKLVSMGGGAFALDAEVLMDSRIAMQNGNSGGYVVTTISVHTVDVMGANAVNTMAESVMKSLISAHECETGMAILSNRGFGRLVHARVEIPFELLENFAGCRGELIAHRLEMASIFAENSPERAVTHNKGIMNGIVSASIPLGQDTRAIEASAYDFACRNGRHLPLSRWFVRENRLCGLLEMPLLAGLVGKFRKNPAVNAAFEFDEIETFDELCAVLASVGLAQNLGAIRALVMEGIQAGHMKLHARK